MRLDTAVLASLLVACTRTHVEQPVAELVRKRPDAFEQRSARGRAWGAEAAMARGRAAAARLPGTQVAEELRCGVRIPRCRADVTIASASPALTDSLHALGRLPDHSTLDELSWYEDDGRDRLAARQVVHGYPVAGSAVIISEAPDDVVTLGLFLTPPADPPSIRTEEALLESAIQSLGGGEFTTTGCSYEWEPGLSGFRLVATCWLVPREAGRAVRIGMDASDGSVLDTSRFEGAE